MTLNAEYLGPYRNFEAAVLALAAFMCPQEVHCDRCRRKAAEHLANLYPNSSEAS